MESSEFVDKIMSCRDCKREFVFSAAEQSFFKEKGLVNQPKRCANCRLLARSQRMGLSTEQTAEVACSRCDRTTRVPFQPNGQRPVLCNTCFHSERGPNGDAERALTPV